LLTIGEMAMGLGDAERGGGAGRLEHPTRSLRLSGKERVILELLAGSELYGLELVRLSDGALKRGTIYTTLGRMQEKGLVESRREDKPDHVPGIPRRHYRATVEGIRFLAAEELAEQYILEGAPA
jgi:DNA-binding PadR family transcriptional regulator